MTDWELCYVEGRTPWDKGAPSPPLQAWLQRQPPGGLALVPGCGLGHDVAMLREAGWDAVGVDLSATAVALARAAHPQHAEHLLQGDLFDLPADWQGRFDLVLEHTCLCALPPERRADYARAVTRLLRPGGRLAGIWFINPEMDPGESGPPFGISVAELDALWPADAWRIVEDRIPAEAYAGRESRERLRVLEKLA